MDPQTQAWFDQYDAQIATTIRSHSWFIVGGHEELPTGRQQVPSGGHHGA
ncbi:MAG: hypothetical protein ACXW15_12800 [Acidimicrobiia bacterium]